ncbi:hypothetical protein [Heliophilum fasciatum]|uniref:hypothetical protein n=1 Tax=Heliophilum fasciatum TaxID=35700 RepID=UPI001051BBA1|nr:hypothetical protein [Heliophilum fasciatum]MCW2277764.1 hypothetical protein [Heliophilum fasciatum]
MIAVTGMAAALLTPTPLSWESIVVVTGPPVAASCTLPNGVQVQFGASITDRSELDKLPGDRYDYNH